MMALLRRLASARQGATAVEFALLSPLLILLMMACINIGNYLFIANSLNNAVDEAARFATLDPKPTATQIRARFDAANFSSAPASAITYTAVTSAATARTDALQITAVRRVPINLVFLNMGTFTVTAKRRIFVPK